MKHHHPEQPFWCWLASVIFGKQTRGGAAWHVDGTDHWCECDRCGYSVSSL